MTTVEHKPDMKALPVHPIADLFPMLAPSELKELKEDIHAHGLHHPIVLDVDGQVLDGRNRLAACAMASVEPMFETYDGKDADAYVLSVNTRRRQMTASQTSITVARAIRLRGLTQREAAKRFKLNQGRIGAANTILDHAPELADEVVAGTLAFDAAYAEARDRKEIGKPGRVKRPPATAGQAIDAIVEPKSGPDKADRASGKDSSPGKTTEPPSMPTIAGKAPGKDAEARSMPDEADSAIEMESTPKPDPKVQRREFVKAFAEAMEEMAEPINRFDQLTDEEELLDLCARDVAAKHLHQLSRLSDILSYVVEYLEAGNR